VSAQTIERLGERARFASWGGDGSVAHLSPASVAPLSAEFVFCCLDWLRSGGYASVVTSALTAPECEGFAQAGFEVHEELDLLVHDLGRLPPVSRRLRRARAAHRAAVVRLDALAFDPFWRLDEGGLDEALAATPHVRFRVAGSRILPPGGHLQGYVIAGRGSTTGYVQRLAVHPEARGRGLGRAMVGDVLRWMRRRGASRALVNTQCSNQAARALYQACGFQLQPEGLQVMARGL
jgi:ribosomal protein S18 acetylase RimI-like enzyme